MKIISVQNATNKEIICRHCEVANNPWTRLRGLLGRDKLEENTGLLIFPCPSIHMWGMKFAIDVVFITRENVVADFVENIQPGKYYVAKKEHGKPHSALELPSGTIAQKQVHIGDQLITE